MKRRLHPEAKLAEIAAKMKPAGELRPVYEIRLLRHMPHEGRWSDPRGKVKDLPATEALVEARRRANALLEHDFEDIYRGVQIKLLEWA